MSVTRRRYPREFKVDAVRRVVEDGQPQTHVARDLDIPVNTLAMWKRQYLTDPGSHSQATVVRSRTRRSSRGCAVRTLA
jgi:transposase